MLRVGLLTSGGDCQGLNAALRGVAKSLYEQVKSVEIYGFRDGYRGLMLGDYNFMSPGDFSGILTRGGTILGTSRQSFKLMQEDMDAGDSGTRLEAMKATYNRLNLNYLVILGGNGTHKTANLLAENGLNVITLPKTIDNDLWATDMTFGFQSAVNIATLVIDSIHSTATSHGRIFVIELMGHKAGWLTLHAGLAGGADIILIPEIPYKLKSVIAALEKRRDEGKTFSIIAMAEGAMTTDEAELSKKAFAKKRSEEGYPSVAYQLAAELGERMGQEIRVTVPGHFQRGGEPSAYDRVLASRCGAKAAEFILDGKKSLMVGIKGDKTVGFPLEDVAGKLKVVPQDDELIRFGRSLGIRFGDEK